MGERIDQVDSVAGRHLEEAKLRVVRRLSDELRVEADHGSVAYRVDSGGEGGRLLDEDDFRAGFDEATCL
jgi:hypothetical protein